MDSKILIILSFVVADIIAASPPLVTVTNGTVSGYYINNVACYLGIPFMQPPIGPLRFKTPVPAENWNGTRNGTYYRAQCPQTTDYATNYSQSEDCLYLNVFTPNVSGKLPVMVFIHGGAYIWGSAYNYQAKGIAYNLAGRAVVVVSIQYRLNVFGFFTTLTPDFPANLAMLDQIQALKWVQAEIFRFGGDPGKVTIFGESAGSSSVSILTYSPLAQGLFTGAIMESGTIYSPFALDGNGNIFFNSSKAFAIATGCVDEAAWERGDLSGFGNCVRNIPWEQLHNISRNAAKRISVCCPWNPMVDGPGGVIPDWPRNLLATRNPNVNILLGTNAQEQYYYYAASLLSGKLTVDNFTINSFNSDVSHEAQYWGQHAEQVAKLVEYNYYGIITPQLLPDDHLAWFQLSDEFLSGYWFFAATLKEAQDSATLNSNVYLYSFDYISDAYDWPTWNNISINGSFHGYELYFVFNMTNELNHILWGLPIWDFSETDLLVSEQLGILWTNFAKTGNPNSALNPNEWKKLSSPTGTNYYSIDYPKSQNKPYYCTQSTQLWNSLIPTALGIKGPTFPPSPKTFGTIQPIEVSSVNHWEKVFYIGAWSVLAVAVIAVIVAAALLCRQKTTKSIQIEMPELHSIRNLKAPQT